MDSRMKARGPEITDPDLSFGEEMNQTSMKTTDITSDDQTESDSDMLEDETAMVKSSRDVDGAVPVERVEKREGYDEVSEDEPMDYSEDATPVSRSDAPADRDTSPMTDKPTSLSSTTGDIDLAKCLERLEYSNETPEGVRVSIYLADLTEDDADVIVNAANGGLEHVGGVAWAIVESGGDKIQRESNRIITEYGILPVGTVCHTSAGHLKSKHVIHAVAPVWREGRKKSKHILHVLLLKVFTYASTHLKAKSLAIPAIGTGVYGMPIDVCANIFNKAIREFSFERDEKTTLDDIRIVLYDVEATGEFLLEFCNAVSSEQPGTESAVLTAARDDVPCITVPVGTAREMEAAAATPNLNDVYSGDVRREKTTREVVRLSTQVKPASPAMDENEIATPSAAKNNCEVCSKRDVDVKSMKCCQATMCDRCFKRHFKHSGKCPFCTSLVLVSKGSQPDDGEMNFKHEKGKDLSGYEDTGTVVMDFNFPDGIQQKCHPNPGQRYHGVKVRGYLPANGRGLQVLALLKRAFDHRLLFIIGKSTTTGNDDVVVLNDVHLKTNQTGGPANHGYPDSTYLDRVTAELEAKGFK